MTTADLMTRASEIMDRVDDALASGNEIEALRLGVIRDVLFAWAQDLETGRMVTDVRQ